VMYWLIDGEMGGGTEWRGVRKLGMYLL